VLLGTSLSKRAGHWSRKIRVNSELMEYIKNPVCPGIMGSPRLLNMYHFLGRALACDVRGDVVELGCYSGSSAILLAKTLRCFGSDKRLHLYDSFEGLTDFCDFDLLGRDIVEKSGRVRWAGEAYRPVGSYKSSLTELRAEFEKRGEEAPFIHVGRFADTLPQELPSSIAFAHLDSDLYAPLMRSLAAVVPRLSGGGVMVVDDYDPAGGIYPGCKVAVEEFFGKLQRPFMEFDLSFLERFSRQAVFINE
jgi:O-methyltransferase